nr:T9SS type A sorting domain-containing protein [Bacteroidota bacterium]
MKKHIKAILFCMLLLFHPLMQAYAQNNFNEHLIDDDTHGMGGIYACDLDGDLDPDILAASLEDNQIIWFRNDGGIPIIWTKIIIGSGVYSAHSVYASDFDNDGDFDVVGAAYSGAPGIAWWRNDGGDPVVWTKFPVAQTFFNAHEVYVEDLDKDDDFDIIGASSDLNTIAWWRNDGGYGGYPIEWVEQIISDSVTLAKSVHVGDIDGDNDFDVVGVAITEHDVIWWRNDGGNPIQWTEFLIDGNFIGAHRVQSIDMDNDGDIDVLGAGYLGHQIAWWRNDGGNPVIWSKQTIATGVTNACVAYAIDLDNDEDLDVVATAQGKDEISWWRNDGNGSTDWTKFIITDTFTRPWPLFVCDLDGDSDNDIISGSSHQGSNEIKWWESDGLVSIKWNNRSIDSPSLLNCFPNPSGISTTIYYEIKTKGNVKLSVFDSSGIGISTIVDKYLIPGKYSIEFDGANLDSGTYYIKLQVDNRLIEIIKVVLIK